MLLRSLDWELLPRSELEPLLLSERELLLPLPDRELPPLSDLELEPPELPAPSERLELLEPLDDERSEDDFSEEDDLLDPEEFDEFDDFPDLSSDFPLDLFSCALSLALGEKRRSRKLFCLGASSSVEEAFAFILPGGVSLRPGGRSSAAGFAAAGAGAPSTVA